MNQTLKRALLPLFSVLLLLLSGCHNGAQLAFLDTPSSADGGAAVIGSSAAGYALSSAQSGASSYQTDSDKSTSSRKSSSSSKETTSDTTFSKTESADKQKLAEKEAQLKKLESDYAVLKASYDYELYVYKNEIEKLSIRLELTIDGLETDRKTLEKLTGPIGVGNPELVEQLKTKIEQSEKEIETLGAKLLELEQQKKKLEEVMADAAYRYKMSCELLKREIEALSGR